MQQSVSSSLLFFYKTDLLFSLSAICIYVMHLVSRGNLRPECCLWFIKLGGIECVFQKWNISIYFFFHLRLSCMSLCKSYSRIFTVTEIFILHKINGNKAIFKWCIIFMEMNMCSSMKKYKQTKRPNFNCPAKQTFELFPYIYCNEILEEWKSANEIKMI